MSQGYDRAVIHATGKVPCYSPLAPEPVHQRGLSHGAHVTQGMEAEPVQGCPQVGGYREQVDGVRGKERRVASIGTRVALSGPLALAATKAGNLASATPALGARSGARRSIGR